MRRDRGVSAVGHFRFRRSAGLDKFVRINVAKTGMSVSVGRPGARINYDLSGTRERPARATLGLPGTGLTYRHDFSQRQLPNLNTKPYTIAIIIGSLLTWLFGKRRSRV